MKKHKLTNVDGVDEARFECFYSPAKRRGPVPGHKQFKENGVGGCGGSETPRSKKESKRQLQPLEASKQGALSISIAEDGSVTSTATGGGFGDMNMSGMNGNMGNSHSQQGKTTGSASANSNYTGNNNNFPLLPPLDPNAAAMQQHVLSTLGSIGFNMFASSCSSNNGGSGGGAAAASSAGLSVGQGDSSGGQDTMASAQNAAQQQLAYIQQLQLQQQMQAQKQRRDMNAAALGNMNAAALGTSGAAQKSGFMNNNGGTATANGAVIGSSRQPTPVPPVQQQAGTGDNETPNRVIGCVNPNVTKYIPLIHPTNPHGMHLRACYTLSFGGLFGLPPIPTDEEYCRRFDKSLEPHQLPKFDVAALQAARFAELAMGALVDSNCNFQTTMSGSLLLALANASVLCLCDCVEERIHPSLMLDVARAYFFHAIFRAQFDDMGRYFKYRRVCLRHLAELDVSNGCVPIFYIYSVHIYVKYESNRGHQH